MSYILQWSTPALPGKTNITVPVASVNTSASSLALTGKGTANYGLLAQQNLLRMLENFASPSQPPAPTIGQLWYDTANGLLKVCVSFSPITWESLGGLSAGPTPPPSPTLGDLWFSQTGNSSGALYTYTGLGRFPENAAWDANGSTTEYPNNTTYGQQALTGLGILLNYDTFTNVNFGEAYVHGFSGLVPADVDGTININGTPVTVPRGPILCSMPGDNFILWDNAPTIPQRINPSFTMYQIRQVGLERWEFDNDAGWETFTPQPWHYVIGTISVGEYDDDTSPGITAGEVWTDARLLSDFTGAPSISATAPAGWQQVWPQIDVAGSRFEYDTVLELVSNLIGSAPSFGGNEAIRTLPLANFALLDAAIREKWTSAGGDQLIARRAVDLFADPISRDWDLLLAAARWAVRRLDLPSSMLDDISQIPFVQDGLQPPNALTVLPTTDNRLPSNLRTSLRRYGTITLGRLFTETVNTLVAAQNLRYTLRGIAGISSTVPTLPPDVVSYTHCQYAGTYSGSGNPARLSVRFNFPSSNGAVTRQLTDFFTYGGCAIDAIVNYTLPGLPSIGDTTLKALVDANSRFRITQDQVRVFPNSLPLTLSSIFSGGFGALTTSWSSLAVVSSSGYQIEILGRRFGAGGQHIDLEITCIAPVSTSGTITFNFNIVHDASRANNSFIFTPPASLQPADVLAAVSVSQQTLIARPVASFTASATTGPAPLLINFTDTSSGAPTSRSWDFTGDEVQDSTLASASFTYTQPGTYLVRLRVANARGEDVTTQLITVS